MGIVELLGYRLSDCYPVWITLNGVFGGQVALDAGKIIDVKPWNTPIKDCAKPTLVTCTDGGLLCTEPPDQVVAAIRKAVTHG